MVIYYCFISNVYATHRFSKDQFFRALTTEGILCLWDCTEFWSQEGGITNHWLGFWWWVAKTQLCRKWLDLWYSLGVIDISISKLNFNGSSYLNHSLWWYLQLLYKIFFSTENWFKAIKCNLVSDFRITTTCFAGAPIFFLIKKSQF